MQKRKSSSANLIPKSEFEFTFFNSDNGKWKHCFIGVRCNYGNWSWMDYL